MFNPPELIALVMSATRMYRSLANFGDTHRCVPILFRHLFKLIMTPRSTNVPSSGQPSTGPRVPVQVPIVPALSPAPAPKKALTLKEELEARIRVEPDPEIQESLVLLYSDLFDNVQP